MSTSNPDSFAPYAALVVGVGGLGCPAALALARAGIGRLVLADDDVVDVSNLHRQILYTEADVGKDKLGAAEAALRRLGPSGITIDLVRSRLLPENARELVRGVDVVVEGADNFATKFLAADACHLEKTPVVHSSAVRFVGTAWAVAGGGKPCYRCLFEDLPTGEEQPNCESAGVLGPVPGFVGALSADLALRMLAGDVTAPAVIHTFDGLRDHLRAVPVSPRKGCPLCGESPTIFDTEETRYTAPSRAA